MKPFIVFLALVLVFSAGFCYMGDMARYRAADEALKAAAVECSAEAALSWDEEAYGEGRLVFDRGEASKIGEALLGSYLAGQRNVEIKSAGFALAGDDDSGEWRICSPGFPAGKIPVRPDRPGKNSVKAWLYVETEDIFALPFLSVTSLCRAGEYRYEER